MESLGKYYIDFSELKKSIDSREWGPFDGGTVPLVNFDKNLRIYRFFLRREFGTHYFPTLIIQYGLSHFDNFLETKQEKSKLVFLKIAQWCKENTRFLPNGAGVIQFNFEFPPYRLNPPWVSAMAQGLATSLFLRVFEITKDSSFLNLAQKFFLSFEMPVGKKGCKVIDDKGNIWFEEYPSNPPSFVLNGFIFALFGIYDFYKFNQSVEAKNLFAEGVKSLNQNLHLYNANGWSNYDRIKDLLVNKEYHLLHIEQLRVLTEILKKENLSSDICEQFCQKWETGLKSGPYQIKLIPLEVKSKVKQFLRLVDLIKQ